MKKGVLFLIICVITMFWACTQEEIIENEEILESKKTKTEKVFGKTTKPHPLAPDIVKDQIVIQYKKKTIEEGEKEEIKSSLENKFSFKVKETKKCKCDDSSIELWVLDLVNSNFGDIEDLVDELSTDKDAVAKLNADYQFSLFVKEEKKNLMDGYLNSIEEMVHPNNSENRVNIAVIDTGIDYDYFDTPFLYNNSEDISNCLGDEISGWDFVNNDNDPRDDRGHGTFVSVIIRDILTQENIPYQILPVKAFDSNGRGTYFDILCSLQFIASKQKPFLVNCSFGFYNLKNQVIFENIVESNSENLLLMASAGNDNQDTDSLGNEHFPSGYESDNLLAVGGYIGDFFGAPYVGMQNVGGFDLAPGSNYGNASIDVVASFEYEFNLKKKKSKNGIKFLEEGTSFSCPIITARAAAVYFKNNLPPRDLKNKVISTGYKDFSLRNKIKNSRIIIEGYYNTGPVGPGPSNLGSGPM